MNVFPRSIPIISLCAGGAMLDIGVAAALRSLGIQSRVLCFCERDSYAQAVLVARIQEQNLHDAFGWSDLTTLPCDELRPYMAGGIVVAGIPCQGNSLAGKRLLEDDERNLWPVTRRILRDMDCKWFYLENVYGLLVPGDGQPAPIVGILNDLSEDGWDAEWDVVSAAEVGANHKRERVFLLAHRRMAKSQFVTGKRGDHEQIRRSDRGTSIVGTGSSMANSERPESRPRDTGIEGLAECRWNRSSNDSAGVPSSAMGDTTSNGRKRGGADRRQGTSTQIGSGLSGCTISLVPGDVGHADGISGGERPGRERVLETCAELPVFAPARNDYRGWIGVLNADPTLVPAIRRVERSRVSRNTEATQSKIRLPVDGLASALEFRTDQLRLAGNGVVWQSAATAFVRLWNRINGGM